MTSDLTMDNEEVVRRAEARRNKILLNREERMKKILLGSRGDSQEDGRKKCPGNNSLIKSKGTFTSGRLILSDELNQPDKQNRYKENDTVADVENDDDGCDHLLGKPTPLVTAAIKSNSCGKDGNVEEDNDEDEVEVEEESVSHEKANYEPDLEIRQRKTDGAQFPRKVSLISSPTNFKTAQQNQANKDRILPIFIYSMIVYINQRFYALIPLLSLILIAVIGSLNRYNFLIPFAVSQLIRVVYVVYKNPSVVTFKLTDLMSAIAAHLIIFLTFYIAINALQQASNTTTKQ